MKGQCLCGAVEFEVHDAPDKIYQCHCSLCRKQSGTASNAAYIVREDQLHWCARNVPVSSYIKPTGFRSDFCSRCGSPVPNPIGNTSYVWVPVGLLESPGNLEIVVHLFVGSKASWEPMPSTGVLHDSMPSLEEVLAQLHSRAGT